MTSTQGLRWLRRVRSMATPMNVDASAGPAAAPPPQVMDTAGQSPTALKLDKLITVATALQEDSQARSAQIGNLSHQFGVSRIARARPMRDALGAGHSHSPYAGHTQKPLTSTRGLRPWRPRFAQRLLRLRREERLQHRLMAVPPRRRRRPPPASSRRMGALGKAPSVFMLRKDANDSCWA